MRATLPLKRIAIDRQPIRHRRDLRQLQIAQRELARFRFVLDRDFVAGLHIEGRDIDVAAVDLHVAVRNELARGAARIGEAEAENDVVEPRLEQLQQRLTGNAALAQRALENAAELPLEQAVLVTKLLLFAERDGVIGLFAAGTFRAVHARRIIFPLERFGRSKERHAIAAADFGFWSGISAHGKFVIVEIE